MKNINAVVAAKVASLVATGSTPVEALRIVCGQSVVDAMISDLYDTLRASK